MNCETDEAGYLLDEGRTRYFGPAGSQTELVALHCLCAWIVVLIVVLVCTMWSRTSRIRHLAQGIRRRFVSCRAWLLGAATEGAQDPKVKDLLDQRRLGRAREMIYWSVFVSSWAAFMLVIRTWPHAAFGSESSEYDVVTLFLYDGEGLFVVLYTTYALVFIRRPEWVSLRMLDCSNIGVQGVFFFRAFTMPAYYRGYTGVWGAFVRIFACIQFGNASLSSFLLSATCAAEVFFKLRVDACSKRPLFELDSHQDPSNLPYARLQGVILAMSIMLVWCVEVASKAEATASIQAKRSQGVEKLVLRLLWGMCDAVVYLGDDHCIQEPAPEALNRLLLRSGPACRLAGRSFMEFFDSAEQERVRACLQAEREEAEQEHAPTSSRGILSHQGRNASLLHTHMQDVSSVKVPVQLFLATVCDLDETLQIVGVKEVADDPGLVQQRFLPGSAPRAPPAPHRSERDPRARSSEGASSAGGPSCSETNSNESGGEHEDVALWTDILSPGYGVLSVSRGFQRCVCSTMRGEKLLNWIRKDEHESFICWIQGAQASLILLADGQPAPETVSTGMPVLFTPHLRKFGLKFKARLEASRTAVPSEPVGEAPREDSQTTVCLHLVDIQWMQRGTTIGPCSARQLPHGAPLAEVIGRPQLRL